MIITGFIITTILKQYYDKHNVLPSVERVPGKRPPLVQGGQTREYVYIGRGRGFHFLVTYMQKLTFFFRCEELENFLT